MRVPYACINIYFWAVLSKSQFTGCRFYCMCKLRKCRVFVCQIRVKMINIIILHNAYIQHQQRTHLCGHEMPLVVFRQFLKLCDVVLCLILYEIMRPSRVIAAGDRSPSRPVRTRFYLRPDLNRNRTTLRLSEGKQYFKRDSCSQPSFTIQICIGECDSRVVSEIKTQFYSKYYENHIFRRPK